MKKIASRMVCALLLIASLASTLIFSVSAADSDYSDSVLSVRDIYADEFLESYTGLDLSEEEAKYLRLQSGFILSYNTEIPTYTIQTEYADGVLTITAEEYVYVSESGTEVVWIPKSATLDGLTKNFDGESYTLSFNTADADANDRVKVDYECKFTIDKETVNTLFTMAYTDAPQLEDEIEEKRLEYERLTEEYLLNTEKYNAYLSALAEYNAYLSVKRIYDEEYAEYEKYLKDKSDYEIAKEAYDNYVAERDEYYIELAKYTEYLAYAEQNLAKIEEYERYRQKYETVLSQLDVILQTKTKLTPLNRTVYDAIMGETVTSVIDRKGDIVKVLGADADVVDVADVATKNLRILLREFFDIKGTEAQYRYYITNYEAFRDNFANLLIALDDLYLVSGVRGAMIAEDKHEKYLILVAQLYYVANALSDKPIKSYNGKYYFDSTYKIGSSYSSDKWSYPDEVIYHEPYIIDTGNAAPLVDGYPIEPEKPEYTMMQEPVAPKPVGKPTPPEEVFEPTAPAVIPEPEKVEKPTAAPTPYLPADEVVEIIAAYNNGELEERVYEGEDIVVPLSISVNKQFLAPDTVKVTYYDREYNDPRIKKALYTVTVDRGTCVDYRGITPTKSEDSEFSYTHIGWVNSNGEKVNLSCVNEDLKLYPVFSATEKQYETVWVANGEVFYENPGTPPLPDGDFYYDFSHWERSVNQISGDVTYTAIYARPAVTTQNEVVKVRFDNGNYVVEPEGVSNKFDLSALIERAAGSGGIIIKTPLGEELGISYAETIRMSELGIRYLEYAAVPFSSGGYTYVFRAYDSDGARVDCDLKIAFSAKCEISAASHFKIYYFDGNDKVFLRNSAVGNAVSFSAVSGRIYYAREEYSASPVPLEAVKISLSHTTAHAGVLVAVTLEAVDGVRVDGVYIMGHDGNKTYLDGNTFVMPSEDVTVGVDYTVLRYKITFTSDGKTIVTYYCNYGEMPTLPSEPQKASNEKYSFAFECWSPTVSEVTGDATYRAVYTLTPIQNTEKNMEITPSVLKLLLLLVVFVGCFVLIVIPSVIMTLVMVSKRKKKLLRRKR